MELKRNVAELQQQVGWVGVRGAGSEEHRVSVAARRSGVCLCSTCAHTTHPPHKHTPHHAQVAMLKSEYASQLTKAESRVVEIAAARDEASATADALRQQLEETKSVAAKVGVL